MDNVTRQSHISEEWEFLCESIDGTQFYTERAFMASMRRYSWPGEDLIELLRKVGGGEYPGFHEAWLELMKQFEYERVSPQIVGGGGPSLEKVKVLGLRPRRGSS